MGNRPLQINLFGACIVRCDEGVKYEIKGVKHRALFALLATAPLGQRTRAFLQDVLWGTACYDTGRQSLRRALADIKKIMGAHFTELLSITNTDIALNLSKVEFIGNIDHAEFLEGMDLKENRFNSWLLNMRQNPEQIHSLYSIGARVRETKIIPYITVLPFRNIGGQDNHTIMGDWLAEEICRSLSRSNLLNVISHLSSQVFAQKSIQYADLGKSLKVDYCLTGSLRQVNGEIIIDADFMDVKSGIIIWTRQFHGKESNFLSRANDGINSIVNSVGRSIADEAVTYVKDRPLPILDDHQLLIAGASLMHRPNLRAFARAHELVEEAVRRSPRSAESHAWLSKWYVLSVFNGWSTDIKADTKSAQYNAAKALDLNPHSAFCLSIDGFVQNNLLKQMDVAEQRYQAAIELNPNDSLSWLLRSALHAFKDEPEEAINYAKKACRLSPIDPFGSYYDSLTATAHLSAKNYEKALELANKSLITNDRHLSTLRVKITALYFLDRPTEAKLAASDLLRRMPDYKVSDYLSGHPSSNYELGQNVARALESAGIP